ncbi:endonuclease/exonuclease/phosphatase family protein [Oleiharenicola sp. Vm1]|uniref:endonuclease/exonuclease/phosphatase family protein n=1 Tax=Oleiharenicola sp. Vm1 TaxID=3398393 RepID=UPI0039F4D74B
MSTAFRVLSWNIHDGKLRPGQKACLTTMLAGIRPDFVVIIEYNPPNRNSTAAQSANPACDTVLQSAGFGAPRIAVLSVSPSGKTRREVAVYARAGLALTPHAQPELAAAAGYQLFQTGIGDTPFLLAPILLHHKGEGPRLQRLLQTWESIGQPCVGIGDFNRDEARWANVPYLAGYYHGGWRPPAPQNIDLHGNVSACGGSDVFTWFGKNVQRRLDYALTTPNRSARIRDLYHVKGAIGSDHRPIVADFEIP